MNKSLALLLLTVVSQAKAMIQMSAAEEDDGVDLTIKMPDAVVSAEQLPMEKLQEFKTKTPKMSSALVENEKKALVESQQGMFESGVFDASLKPILKAKVNKVMNFLKSNSEEYEQGTADQKSAIIDKASSLIMTGTGVRGYNLELCHLLWAEATEEASKLSFMYCPALQFPPSDMAGIPPYTLVKAGVPSRLRSAYLTQHFWREMLTHHKRSIQMMMAPDICYYQGTGPGVCGHGHVSQSMPYVGFPDGTYVGEVVRWHCDTFSCLVPITAWGESENYCLSTFNEEGLVTEVIIPLDLWSR